MKFINLELIILQYKLQNLVKILINFKGKLLVIFVSINFLQLFPKFLYPHYYL